MATKEEYIDVLGQMEELYCNNDNCTLAMNLFKEDYIGQVGSITHTQKMLTGNGSATNLFDITFEDGARFCVDREQIEFVED